MSDKTDKLVTSERATSTGRRVKLRERKEHAPIQQGRKSNDGRLTVDGREISNPTPIAPPLGYVRRPPLHQQIRDMIKVASIEAAQQGDETLEEADNFDIPDDPIDPESPWEEHFDPFGYEPGAVQKAAEIQKERAAQAAAAREARDKAPQASNLDPAQPGPDPSPGSPTPRFSGSRAGGDVGVPPESEAPPTAPPARGKSLFRRE